MSDPWIKVYPADMRGDPKLDGVNADLQLALIHAWDLAKNGPGAIAELRASDGRAMAEKELRRIAKVSGAATRRMFERWASRDLCVLEDDDGRTLVTFPDLAKRQGIDATAADRKRRERERKRHGNVTPMSRSESREKSRPMSRDVTGENQKKKKKEPPPSPSTVTQRQPDPIWDALLEACPAGSDMTKSERGRRNAAVKELREISADPADVRLVARRLREKWGGRVALTPSAIVTNWSAALAEIRPNGGGRTWTREDADRAAAQRAEVEEQQRQRAAAAAEPEEIPY